MSSEQSQKFLHRLRRFALGCAKLVSTLPRTRQNIVYGDQLIRSSASPGANYSEALCALTRKDFTYDMNKCRKESNESVYWLELLLMSNDTYKDKINPWLEEAKEITKIFQKSALTLRKK